MNSKAKNEMAAQMASQLKPDGLAGYMNSAGMAMREKLWPERNADEKFEALRECVTQLVYRLAEAESTIRKLRGHGHSPSGDIVVYLREIEGRIDHYDLRLPVGLRDGA